MKMRTPVSLFPFLSVLISTMGVLSFLAVTFLLFARSKPLPAAVAKPVEVRWVGAPAHVRPLLVECREKSLVVHSKGAPSRTFSRKDLRREVGVVKDLVDSALGSLGPAASRTQLWLFLKTTVPDERRLRGSFTLLMHSLEIDNISGAGQKQQIERYPILLIYPDGVETYELASYLLETTTRLAVGLEPMLKGWKLPYQDKAS